MHKMTRFLMLVLAAMCGSAAYARPLGAGQQHLDVNEAELNCAYAVTQLQLLPCLQMAESPHLNYSSGHDARLLSTTLASLNKDRVLLNRMCGQQCTQKFTTVATDIQTMCRTDTNALTILSAESETRRYYCHRIPGANESCFTKHINTLESAFLASPANLSAYIDLDVLLETPEPTDPPAELAAAATFRSLVPSFLTNHGTTAARHTAALAKLAASFPRGMFCHQCQREMLARELAYNLNIIRGHAAFLSKFGADLELVDPSARPTYALHASVLEPLARKRVAAHKELMYKFCQWS
ncbi:hypothetical protein RI367_000436 [Sorochytrium milnesiophthora]